MRSLTVTLLVLAACGGKTTDACEIVRGDPASARAALAKRYPGDTLKIVELLERCLAPTGDACEKLAKVITVAPEMTPGVKTPPGEIVEACRAMPEASRRCMQPSYALTHAAECGPILQQLIASEVEGVEIPIPGAGKAAGCELMINVSRAGTWLGQSAEASCFAKRKGGAIDTAWLEAELRRMIAGCSATLYITSEDGVGYKELLAVMDTVNTAGVRSVSLGGSWKDAPIAIDDRDPTKAAARCPEATSARPPTGSNDALAKALVVAISRTGVHVDGTLVVPLTAVVGETGIIAPLAKALPAKPADGSVIVQVEASIDARTVQRVVATLKGAGYTNVMMAVDPK